MIPPWIVAVLDRELPHLTGAERDRIAEAIYESAFSSLKKPIIAAIASGAQTVLDSRTGAKPTGALAAEIARNSAADVFAALGEG